MIAQSCFVHTFQSRGRQRCCASSLSHHDPSARTHQFHFDECGEHRGAEVIRIGRIDEDQIETSRAAPKSVSVRITSAVSIRAASVRPKTLRFFAIVAAARATNRRTSHVPPRVRAPRVRASRCGEQVEHARTGQIEAAHRGARRSTIARVPSPAGSRGRAAR